MSRSHLCVRPDCSEPAEAVFRYDYAERTVWLELLSADLDAGEWGLCGSHADRLTVPTGWSLEDHRPLTLLPVEPPAPPVVVPPLAV
ncbi:MAG TPA: DUF3499 family protein [Acidimicrobiales bacterium]|nr:DUF3499 family protein [Acidimicrobiales bacterium]